MKAFTLKASKNLQFGLSKKAITFALLSVFSFQSLGGLAAPLPDTLPTGYQVQAGSVGFNTSAANTLNVNSRSAKSIVNYDSFSIGSAATVNFNLPSSSSAILNRVVGDSLSEIFGKLNSNGKVFLINPNGILFGAGSEVNVGGLIASTLSLSNSNFLNGNYVFNRLDGKAPGSIINNGTIDSKNFTAFLAGAVSNTSDITSRVVGFGVGDKINLSFGGNVGMELTVTEPLKEKVAGFNTAISNSGFIDSTFTEFEAFVSKSLYDSMVNNTGTVSAIDLVSDKGSFRLTSKVFDSNTFTYELTDENKLAHPKAVVDDNGTPDDDTDDFLTETIETTAIGGNSFNSGDIFADSVSIKTGTLRNTGTIGSFGNLDISLTESKSIEMGLADRTLDHNPGNYPTEQMEPGFVQVDASDYYFNLAFNGVITFTQAFQFISQNTTGYVIVPGLVPHRSETISYGLLNQGTLTAGRDLTVESKTGDIVNRNTDSSDALIEARNNLTLKAIAEKPLDESDPLYTPSVINQRAGYNTTYSYEERYIGDTPHDFETWNDVAPSKNAILRSGKDLVIEADKNVVNSGGMIQAGVPSGGLDEDGNLAVPTGDLKITAENFINTQPVLQQTIREHWIRERLFGNDHRERWYHESLTSPPAYAFADNMFLGLDGNFTNTGFIKAENDFNLGAKDIINGLWGTKDARVANPPNFIPGTIVAKNINIDGVGRLLNSGWIYAEEDLDIKAQKIENIRRTATKIANVKHNRGLFRGSTYKHIAYEEIQEGGILESGGDLKINAGDSFYNRGGLVKAETDLTITAPKITNTVTEGSEVITWNPGNLGKLLGVKNWGHKAVYSPGQIIAGGDITLDAKSPAGSNGTILNQGSDIISKAGDINIKADKLVEQNWVASTYTASDKVSFSGLKIEHEKETAHVTRGSTIAALDGNVNIEVGDSSTRGTFRNIASDVIALDNPSTPLRSVETTNADGTTTSTTLSAGNISVNADNIEISDAIHQSMNEYDSLSLNFKAPSTVSLDFQSTDYTVTTHQSSNLIASGNVSLGSSANPSSNVTITGSNILAGNNVSIDSKDTTIQNGLYTDTSETVGGGTYTTIGYGSITGGAYGFESESSRETLTPSLILGNNISINSSNQTNIQSSILGAENTLTINSPTLNIGGEYQRANSETTTGGFSVTYVPPNMVSVGVNGSYSYSRDGTYVESVLSAPNLNLNSSNRTIDGAIINGEEVNPNNHQDYSESHSTSVSFSAGTAGVSAGVGYDDFSIAGGVGNSNFVSVGYDQFSIGAGSSTNGNGSHTTSVFGSAYGVNGSFGQTTDNPGITNDHPVFSGTVSYGAFGAGASFQHGEIRTVSGGVGPLVDGIQVSDWDTVCFVAGTPITMADGSTNAIETLKKGEKVLSWNEETKKLENKTVLHAFRKETKKLVKIQLADKLIEATPDHPFWVNGSGNEALGSSLSQSPAEHPASRHYGWTEAGKLNLDDKLLDEKLNPVSIVSLKTVDEVVPVYNLEIEDNHTYFAHGVLVHNVDCLAGTLPNGDRVLTNGTGSHIVGQLGEDRDNSGTSDLTFADSGYVQTGEVSSGDRALTDAESNHLLNNPHTSYSDISLNTQTGVLSGTQAIATYQPGTDNSFQVEIIRQTGPIADTSLSTIYANPGQQLQAGLNNDAIFLNAVGSGIVHGGQNLVNGVATVVTNPGSVVQGAVNAVAHPVQTVNGIIEGVQDGYQRIHSDDPQISGQVIGEGLTDVAVGVITDGALSGAGKVVGKLLDGGSEAATKIATVVVGASDDVGDVGSVNKVNGRIPINSKYANQTFPLEKLSPDLQVKYPNSVKFNAQGFPDFKPYAEVEVKVSSLTGDNRIDAKLANREAHLSSTPSGYTWHHVEDGLTMQLVPTDLHQAVNHTGGAAVIRSNP